MRPRRRRTAHARCAPALALASSAPTAAATTAAAAAAAAAATATTKRRAPAPPPVAAGGALEANTALFNLDLSSNGFAPDSAGLAALAAALASNVGLIRLGLREQPVGEASAAALAGALEERSAAYHPARAPPAPRANLARTSRATSRAPRLHLPRNATLLHLMLSDGAVGAGAAARLEAALGRNRAIDVHQLSTNGAARP